MQGVLNFENFHKIRPGFSLGPALICKNLWWHPASTGDMMSSGLVALIDVLPDKKFPLKAGTAENI